MLLIASYTITASLVSSFEVISSKTKIYGFLIKACAIIILYFCPLERFLILESRPFSELQINSAALDRFIAVLMSSSVASGFSNCRFSLTVSNNNTDSLLTQPIFWRKFSMFNYSKLS